jgi:ABC-type transporter Mla maintaining outer membrane lipid asymmetry permease subunit MlaE
MKLGTVKLGTLNRLLDLLEAIGAWVLRMGDWALTALGLAARALATLPQCRQGPIGAEFMRMLRLSLPGCLRATVIVGLLVGVTLIGQGIYWIEFTGQTNLLVTLLVDVLARELGPILATLVLLLRVGTQNLVELGAIRAGPAWRALVSRGLDPWQLLAAPRALAAAVAGATLSVLVVLLAGLGGGVWATLSGLGIMRPGVLIEAFLRGMTMADYVLLPFKGALMAFLAMQTTALVAMASHTLAANPARLLPRGVAAGAGAALAGSVLCGMLT